MINPPLHVSMKEVGQDCVGPDGIYTPRGGNPGFFDR